MGDRTGIEWTDATWNPILGCTHVSAGCDHCYAASLASGRLAHIPVYAGLAENGVFNGTIRLLPERLDQPLRWKRPRMIFVNSMSDLFHDGVPDDYIEQVFDVMEQAHWHIFQVLTKRPGRMRSFMRRRQARREDYATQFSYTPTEAMRTSPAAHDARRRADNPPSNIWLGTSAEDQHWAQVRLPLLLDTWAAVRFVSAEPLLGPLDLDPWLKPYPGYCQTCGAPLQPADAISCDACGNSDDDDGPAATPTLRRLDWVIVGGESGNGARPMDPRWATAIAEDCQRAGVPFLFKQWGEWAPAGQVIGEIPARTAATFHDRRPQEHWFVGATDPRFTHTLVKRVGKKAAGRTLDGSLFDGYPA